MTGIPDYQAQRTWTAYGSVEHVKAALIFGAKGSLLMRVVSDEGGRLVVRLGSRVWFGLEAGLFTPNALVPMTLLLDLRIEAEAITIEATAMSNLSNWMNLIPRPGDRGRYEDAFDRLFSNLTTATSS